APTTNGEVFGTMNASPFATDAAMTYLEGSFTGAAVTAHECERGSKSSIAGKTFHTTRLSGRSRPRPGLLSRVKELDRMAIVINADPLPGMNYYDSHAYGWWVIVTDWR